MTVSLSNFNMTGEPDKILVYLATVPWFTSIMLIAIWVVFTSMSFFAMRSRGTQNFFLSGLAGSIITFFVATILRLKDGIISGTQQLVLVLIMFIFGLLYFVNREQ